MNGLFFLIRQYTATVPSTLKNLPGEIGNIRHFLNLTQPLFSFLLDAGPPLPQSSEVIQTCQPKLVYPASPIPSFF